MPDFYTNDVALALPGAIDGPFMVVDSADMESYLQLDPAAAVVRAAGGARPTRCLPLGFTKTVGTSTAGTLGTALATRIIAVDVSAGYLCTAFRVPIDMDVSAASRVLVLIAPSVSSSSSGKQVRVELTVSYGRFNDSAMSNLTVDHDWTAPDSWAANDPEVVTVDDGSGDSIAANTLEQDDMVGIRLRLARAAAADTFDQPVHIGVGAVFEYTAQRF